MKYLMEACGTRRPCVIRNDIQRGMSEDELSQTYGSIRQKRDFYLFGDVIVWIICHFISLHERQDSI